MLGYNAEDAVGHLGCGALLERLGVLLQRELLARALAVAIKVIGLQSGMLGAVGGPCALTD
ncbi:hypothetical protein [Devosia sp. UYZn731]|uniref:hypothetical protein n=1 Tax=Devosia sp. UYZn731 TaxID=3156345 RepID=UPI0033956EBA